MPRILVVFHSRTGTCRKVAMRLGSEGSWAVAEVEVRPGARSFGRCAAQALLHLRPKFTYDGPDPAAFDLLVVVSPVWCGTLAAPMRSFLACHRGALPLCAVLSVMGGRGAEGAVRAIEAIVGRPACVTAALREDAIHENRHHKELADFVRRVEAVIGPTAAAQRRVA